MANRPFSHTLVLCCMFAAFPCHAQDAADAAPAIEAELTMTGVSDYRYRGVSLSDRNPALQGQVTLTHKSGAYIGAWASTIAENGGDDIETQALIGYSTAIGGTSLDFSASYYFYPGARQDNYAELAVRLGRSFGPLEVGALASYAPAQSHIGGVDNLYLALDGSLALPGTPLSLIGSIGFEDGAFANAKRDWSLGVSGTVANFDCSLTYVDATRTMGDVNADATIVFALSKTF